MITSDRTFLKNPHKGLSPTQPQTSSLNGRKVTVEPRVTVGTLIPTSSRVTAFVYLLFGASLIILAVLMRQGTISVDPTVVTGFQYAAGIVGALQVISIPLIIYFVRQEIKNREHNLRLLSDLPPRPPRMPSSQSSQNSRPLIQTPPIPADEWQTRIKSAQNVGQTLAHKFFNLSEPNTPFNVVWNSEFQIPWFGKKSGDSTIGSDSCLMAVKLPPQQIKKFPQRIKSWFMAEKVITQDCYFMVFDNRLAHRQKKEWKDPIRNLALHGLALPEYNPAHPDVPDGNPTDVTRHSESSVGISVDCKIALFEPQGVQVSTIKQIGNGSQGPRGAASKTKLFVHNDANGFPMISYKEINGSEAPQAEFEILQDQFAVSSAYFGATFRGKGVAIHALFLNDDQSDNGAQLVTALNGQTLDDFLTTLSSDRIFCCNVSKTFS